MKQPPVQSSPEETLEELLRLSGRGYTKIRHSLCQIPNLSGGSRPGLLGPMVTDRKRRSLQLYLLLLTVWPWLKERDDPLAAAVWARAVTTASGRRWSPSNVSDAWTDLEDRGLIERRRLSRGVVITPRREDGAATYSEPDGVKGDHLHTYFTLPPSFWTMGWFEELSMPGLAMLLIVASKTSRADQTETWLTNADAGKWFALSPRSVEGGVKELDDRGLLAVRSEWVKAPLSPIGATKQRWYSLNGEFSTDKRLEMQAFAKDDRARRLGAAKPEKLKKAKTIKKGASSDPTKPSKKTTAKKATKPTGTRARKKADS
ncbi:MAG: ArsR family transcriptional regulator [Actinomycetota bacterium]|nr:ArsR family transcriptional regulator [Actinomycetota bacterium]